ncbi:MAG: serine/threonine protein kinase [Gammaproteobacteria bacterium]|nr:serine/threonine protein kinase [Gammaproteobacteria bacterium]
MRYIVDQDLLPPELLTPYRAVVEQCLERIEADFAAIGPRSLIRLHGDCHLGNILWEERTPFFVDLDDCVTGPAVQDLWMLMSGDRAQRSWQINTVLEGYETFRAFDPAELGLIEGLRTLRMINYAAWLARRWSDPAFPLNFPWFNTQKYWEEQILAFKGQLAEMYEPPLQRLP